MTAAAPTVTRPVGRRSSYSARDPDPGSLVSNLLETSVRFQFRDRRPRYFPVRSRVGVGRTVRPSPSRGQWHPRPYPGASMVGRTRRTDRDARTRCQDAPTRRPAARPADSRLPFGRCPCLAPDRAVLVLASPSSLARRLQRRRRRRRSTRPAPCTTDGRAPGAYPDLEALVPTTYEGAPPETPRLGAQLHGRRTSGSLARLGINEVRFAGGTWTFGAERAAVLAVFRTPGLTADDLAAFYDDERAGRGADRRSSAQSHADDRRPAGPPPRHEDRRADCRPSSSGRPRRPDVVNVVITNDLPTRGSRTRSTPSEVR